MTLSQKRIDALHTVDRMPSDLRACVHEFGLPIVTVMMQRGINNPDHIREIVAACWSGGRQHGQGNDSRGAVDSLLANGIVTYDGLCRFLALRQLVIAPISPTREMLDASMAAVSGHNVRVIKEEKHRRRLRAAMLAIREADEGTGH
ncbi:MAG: hypothetical protein RIB97_13245 [Nitratireductor sp.]